VGLTWASVGGRLGAWVLYGLAVWDGLEPEEAYLTASLQLCADLLERKICLQLHAHSRDNARQGEEKKQKTEPVMAGKNGVKTEKKSYMGQRSRKYPGEVSPFEKLFLLNVEKCYKIRQYTNVSGKQVQNWLK